MLILDLEKDEAKQTLYYKFSLVSILSNLPDISGKLDKIKTKGLMKLSNSLLHHLK